MLSALKYALPELVKSRAHVRIASALTMRQLVIAGVFALCVFRTSAIGSEVLEDVVERTIPLGPAGIFALHGTDGTIQIYGTDSSEINVFAIRRCASKAVASISCLIGSRKNR